MQLSGVCRRRANAQVIPSFHRPRGDYLTGFPERAGATSTQDGDDEAARQLRISFSGQRHRALGSKSGRSSSALGKKRKSHSGPSTLLLSKGPTTGLGWNWRWDKVAMAPSTSTALEEGAAAK